MNGTARRAVMLTGALVVGSACAQAFDWQQQRGANLTIALVKHPMADAIIKYLPEFQKLTGINVKFEQYSEEEYFQKLLTDLASGSGTYDAFMTGPTVYVQYAAAGWIEPLDSYLNNPKLTAPDYKLTDFYPAALNVNRWDKAKGLKGRGQGPLYAIPVNEEGYSLFYRKDILAKFGIPVPQTFDQLLAAAQKLNGQTYGGKKLNGFVARGQKSWATLMTGYSTVYFGYGADDIGPDGKFAINSSKSVAANEMWAKLMATAPKSVGSYSWYEAMNDFAAGNTAFFIDADHMSETFEKKGSAVAGKVGYALPPAGPAGRASNIWLWSMGMSSQAKNKNAAWLFTEWASSKATMEKTIPFGNINPTRRSLATGPTMKSYTAKWGGYNTTWQTILDKYAKWRYFTSPKFPEAGDRWALAVQEIVLGQKSAKAALDAAQADMTNILGNK